MCNQATTCFTHVYVCKQTQELELGNPRFYWTYSDEDLQRLAKEIAQSCHVDNLPAMVLYNYLIWVFDA